jgi:FlaA1/EpsC-like NDP-sugar epimerase
MKQVGISAQALLRRRTWVSAIVQAGVIFASLFFAWLLRFEFTLPQKQLLGWSALLLIAIRLVFIRVFHLLHGWWSYAGIYDAVAVLKATAAGSAVFFLVLRYLLRNTGFPLSIYLMEFVLTATALCMVRVVSRLFAEAVSTVSDIDRVLVVGAGFAAQMLLRELKQNGDFQVVGCVDDDPSKARVRVLGVKVLGTVDALPDLVQRLSATEILIAVPSATSREMRRIVEICERAGVRFRTIPGMRELIKGVSTASQLRQVQPEDLLNRDAVAIDVSAVSKQISGRGVMITGAAGSIGSELCRQILDFSPSELLCVDINENGTFFLEQELSHHPLAKRVRYVVADVGNPDRMQQVLACHSISIVFHAAAYKHVGVMEVNVTTAIRNNIFALMALLRVSEAAGCSHFVMISSDKAVNPTSVMGCTKRIGELILASRPSPMRCLSVRFGNVLGSNGSVIPVFQEQLRKGFPITITHPEITRYFMTINEAVSLVLEAAVVGKGRDILVLDMGEPVKIVDLARTIIRLSGKSLDEIEIKFTGLRKGEKLYEELFYADEKPITSSCSKVTRTAGQVQSWQSLNAQLEKLRLALSYADANHLRQTLAEIVPQYKFQSSISWTRSMAQPSTTTTQ